MPLQLNGKAHPISPELGSVLLDTLGLVAALEWHGQRLERQTGLRCELTLNDAAGVDLPEAWAATILDIYAETLSSVHPCASRVAVALTITAQHVTMVMRDDGSGPGTTFRLSLAAP